MSNINNIPLRTCRVCGIHAFSKEELNLFVTSSRNKHGKLNQCKDCTNKRNRERRKKNPFHYLCLAKKSECKRKQIPFNLTDIYLKKLWKKQGGLCILSGLKMEKPYNESDFDWVASLDRIQFDKGYVKGNVRWIINAINTLKRQKDDAFVYKIAQAIVNHNDLHHNS